MVSKQPCLIGVATVRNKPYSYVIELAFPHIQAILHDIREDAKTEMKALPSSELGIWEQTVMTSDGCWQIRGFFSQNSMLVVKNYLTGALLW